MLAIIQSHGPGLEKGDQTDPVDLCKLIPSRRYQLCANDGTIGIDIFDSESPLVTTYPRVGTNHLSGKGSERFFFRLFE